jgi:hypothetical protein
MSYMTEFNPSNAKFFKNLQSADLSLPPAEYK